MNHSRKLSEVFVLIIPQVIRMHFCECQWEVVVVCSSRRVLRRLGGVRIFVLIIHQVARVYFSSFKVVVVCRPRKGLKI